MVCSNCGTENPPGRKFCGACGQENRTTSAGHARVCPACGNETFPRTDPAVIVLVTRGNRCLLGRASRDVGLVLPIDQARAVFRPDFDELGTRSPLGSDAPLQDAPSVVPRPASPF